MSVVIIKVAVLAFMAGLTCGIGIALYIIRTGCTRALPWTTVDGGGE